MNNNPYAPPAAPPTHHPPDDIPGLIRSREFREGFFAMSFSTTKLMRRLRERVEVFINTEVGVHNVVAINEHTGFDYSIVVWYRTPTV